MKTTLVAAAVLAALAAGAAGGVYWARLQGGNAPADHASHAGHGPSQAGAAASGAASAGASTGAAGSTASGGRRVLYWHDPMVPQQKFDKPGRSPFMDMDLVPVYADEGGDAGKVTVSARQSQNLGLRTALAETGRLDLVVQAVGAVAFDERAVTLVQSRTAGFVEQLFVRAPLEPVRKGQPLARIFVPEWAGAQEEYLALRASRMPGADELARAARNRLLLLNMSEQQVQAVEQAGAPQPRITLHAPADGVVGELGAREGMTLMPGQQLFRLNGLGTVWVNVDIPESMAAAVVPGAAISATVPAYPGDTFTGTLQAVLPEVAETSRTLRARVVLANPAGRLKPGMYATLSITPRAAQPRVLVPSEALIPTGRRTVVVVDRGEGRFEPVEVRTGREQGGRTEVLHGLEEGTRVVVSGQFLIDSEASLRGSGTRMGEGDAAREYHTDAKLEKIEDDFWTITHAPVPELRWGEMTMSFIPMKGGLPPGFAAGQDVKLGFTLDKDGMPVVSSLARKPAGGKSTPSAAASAAAPAGATR